MYRIFIFAVFAIMACMFQPNSAFAKSAEDLDIVCNSVETDEGHEFKSALCLGYIHGVIDHERLRSNDVAANGIFCIRDEVSFAELRGIVRRYIATRPDRGSELASILVSEALEAAFPCRKAG